MKPDVCEQETTDDTDNQRERATLRQRRSRLLSHRDNNTFIERPEEQPDLDFSPSSTALNPSDAKQDMGKQTVVGRFDYTPNATFTIEDLPAQSDEAETLNQLNRETTDESEHIEQARRDTDLRRQVRAWGNHIGLTDLEVNEAVRIVESVPAGARRNFGLDPVCLAALSISANQPTCGRHTSKSIRLRGPNTDTHALVQQYESIREDMGVTQRRVSEFRSWYNRNHL